MRLPPAQLESIWQELETRGEVQAALDDQTPERALQDLVDAAHGTDLYGIVKNRPKSGGRPPQERKEYFEITLGQYEKEKAEALSEALALGAARRPAVVAFRKDVLGGVISPNEAHAFVNSPAVRSFSRRLFERWGIPLVGHEATVVRTDKDVKGFRWGPDFSDFIKVGFRPWIDRFVSIYVDPPGVEKSILYGPGDINVPEEVHVDEHIFFRENDEVDEFVREVPEKVVRYPWEDRIHVVRALPNSLLDELLGLSNALTDVYGWRQEDALWFVLTGQTPRINSVEVGASLLTGHESSPPVWNVTLNVSPWVSADTVKGIYEQILRQIKGGDVSKGEIKELRKLRVFRFVTEQKKNLGECPSWQTLFDLWNQVYPEGHKWHYADASSFRSSKKPWDTFQRDYRDARQSVLEPEHYFPSQKVNTSLEAWQEEDLRRRRAAMGAELKMIVDYLDGKEDGLRG